MRVNHYRSSFLNSPNPDERNHLSDELAGELFLGSRRQLRETVQLGTLLPRLAVVSALDARRRSHVYGRRLPLRKVLSRPN